MINHMKYTYEDNISTYKCAEWKKIEKVNKNNN